MHIVYSVPQMHCQHCVRAIEGAVSALPGVEAVGVDLVAKTVDVRFQGDVVSADIVRDAIEGEGYGVVDSQPAPD